MIEGLLGRKVGMTRIFDETGTVVPVTVIQAGPCYVTQIKTRQNDGYSAVQIGFGEAKRLTAPEKGHLGLNDREKTRGQKVNKAKLPQLRHLREMMATDLEEIKVGQLLDASLFAAGETVDVIGVSKGKGFAGVVKRHHFRGGPKTHGQSDRLRAPGSAGSGTTPGRVLRGMRMAGRMGGDRVTVKNLIVVQADPARNVLLIRGAVPGARDSLVMVRKARTAV
jgi:large subunit ribosomal protein L3